MSELVDLPNNRRVRTTNILQGITCGKVKGTRNFPFLKVNVNNNIIPEPVTTPEITGPIVTPEPNETTGSCETLEDLFQRKIVVLDGAMGTMIQKEQLSEDDYRGDFYQNKHQEAGILLKGNNEMLSLTHPEIIQKIHEEYLEAGADIVETNTFNANSISQSDYLMVESVYEMNHQSALIARRATDKYRHISPRFVAGAIGPTNQTLSLSPKVEDPSFRNLTWRELVDAYLEQIKGLVDGGVDCLLVETIFDTLNAKAALFAIETYYESTNTHRLPLIISGTITDASGRTLSGQTLEAFYTSIFHSKPLCVGLNCALGADKMEPYLERLSQISEQYVHAYPNAGLPNAMGEYDETPEIMAQKIGRFVNKQIVNMVGGCCGSTPQHIQALVKMIEDSRLSTRSPAPPIQAMLLSGLEMIKITPELNFVNIGERCNISGSLRFKRMIMNNQYVEALQVARDQVDQGAQILDINMDEGMLDSKECTKTFCNYISSEPDISKVPIMCDSSKFEVIQAGLECLQGRSIVNSISLKEGETDFLQKAKLVKKYGAAVVVMAFDEQGQATEIANKVAICRRSYQLLVDQVGINPWDIIFDLNILTIATGMSEHDKYAMNFIKATEQIKSEMPHVHISGGLSNLSFGFRGLNKLREQMNSVFLYHAIQAGMNLGIVNAGALPIYEDIDQAVRTLIEDAILYRSDQAPEKLIQYAEQEKDNLTQGTSSKQDTLVWRSEGVSERIIYAIIHGIDKFIVEDVEEIRKTVSKTLEVIDGPLMKGMSIVGDYFGSGKMFLPQVIKSARVMKRAVAYLTPFMEREKTLTNDNSVTTKGKILLATVKGDVHDIGKNIVGVVLECNNYQVINLGIMVPSRTIIEEAIKHKVDIIGLSGLITPSLDEMVQVARDLEESQLRVPLLIGGATTSKQHTAIKIAPNYREPVIHVLDAARSVPVVNYLLKEENRDEFITDTREQYQEIRDNYYQTQDNQKYYSWEESSQRKYQISWETEGPAIPPKHPGITLVTYSIEELREYIDWTPFFSVWQLRGRYPNKGYPKIFEDERVGSQAKKIFSEAQQLLDRLQQDKSLIAKGVIGLFPANQVKSDGDSSDLDIEIFSQNRTESVGKLVGIRQQMERPGQSTCMSLSDFIAPKPYHDHIGLFAVSCGFGVETLKQKYKDTHDDYHVIMVDAVADRLVEAFAERLHLDVRTKYWGYQRDSTSNLDDTTNVTDLIYGKYQGIRPAPGYPSQPDHSEKDLIWKLLSVRENTNITLTDTRSMNPGASICGLYFSHPKSRYFDVGKIKKDQVESYAQRKDQTTEMVERNLATILSYDT